MISTSTNRIVVLASGNGSTFQAIVDAISREELNAKITLLITDRSGIPVLARASAARVPAVVVDRKETEDLSDRILRTIPIDTTLIVLAGFLSILQGEILHTYRKRIVNLHPSLLPKYGGPGMYGIHVHQAVIAGGERESGCTVHYVDEGTDTGPIILQRTTTVHPEDTPERLAHRVREIERTALIDGIRLALRDASP